MKAFIALAITISLIILFSFFLALPAMWLWNNVLTSVFPSINSIGWFDMWGLIVLTQFLMGTAARLN